MLGMTYHKVPRCLTSTLYVNGRQTCNKLSNAASTWVVQPSFNIQQSISQASAGGLASHHESHFGGTGGQGLRANSNIAGTHHMATVGAGNSNMASGKQTNGRSALTASWETLLTGGF